MLQKTLDSRVTPYLILNSEATMLDNQISQKITARSLIKFISPTILMTVFMSLYTVVDGLFIARFVNSNALAALNIVFPLIGFCFGIGIMLGTGGSAMIGKLLGEGKRDEANRNFTMIICYAVIIGVIFSILAFIFLEPMLYFLGSTNELYSNCKNYIVILLPFFTLQIVQVMLSILFVTAGKPTVGLVLTIASGVTNIVLDYIFLAILKTGIEGAAWATAIGFSITPIFALFYFFSNNASLRFIPFKFKLKPLIKSCSNGFSEMVNSLSGNIIIWLMNIIIIKMAGEIGVAALSAVLYIQYLFNAIFIGIANGVSPVISYHYGAENQLQMRKTLQVTIWITAISSIAMTISSILLAKPLGLLFLGSDTIGVELTEQGALLYSASYLFVGFNIVASALFTALSNGVVSAMLSAVRTLVLTIVSIIVMSWLFQLSGLWLSVPAAEAVAVLISLVTVKLYNKHYGYLK